MSALFREMAPQRIAEIRRQIDALERNSEEVKHYKQLCQDMADWQRALGGVSGEESATAAPGRFTSAWPAQVLPAILRERGEPMTRRELKSLAISRGVRTGSSPDADLDRYLTHACNYGVMVEYEGKIGLAEWRVRKLLDGGHAVTIEELVNTILPERTRQSKIRSRYESNFRSSVLQPMIDDGAILLEKNRVSLKQ